MKNKLFIASLATAIAIPAVVAPLQAEAVVKNPFKDVSKNSPYYDIIHEMRDLNIISGYENGQFKPNEVITRKHAAALVNRAKNLPATKPFVKFKDVSEKNPYFNDVKKLQQAGIFTPDAKGNFNPNQPITRAEMAKVLAIAFELEVKAEYDFPDVPKNHSANQYVRAIYSNGITTGDNGYFKPNESLTRAHYAVFMHRALNVKDGGVTVGPIKPVKPNPTTPKFDVNTVTAKEFNEAVKNNPFFANSDGVAVPEIVFGNKDYVRVLVNLEETIKDKYPKQQVVRFSSNIYLHDKNYSSYLKDNGLYHGAQAEVWYGEKSVKFTLDQTDPTAVNLVNDLMKVAFPDLNFEKEYFEHLEYVSKHFMENPKKPAEPLMKVFEDKEGFKLIRIGTSDYKGFQVQIYRE